MKAFANEAEWILEHQCKADCIAVIRNYRFHPTRKFEIDCAVVDAKAGIEVEA